jgi:16S rRNA (uracil1498-N3)-methyltransferase
MAIRLHVAQPLASGIELSLPEDAARHAQVRRVQPGDELQLFDGRGGEWLATVTAMGRREVGVRIGEPVAVTPELPLQVTLAVGVPANERMDTLVEKAAELGVAVIQPLQCERSVVRLTGERAQRRQAHWQGIAVAACEQCGRATVPQVEPIRSLAEWLALPRTAAAQWLLSPHPTATAVVATGATPSALVALSGPEGGLTPQEEQAAQAAGFRPVSLGPRILRADTAPLALLAWLGLRGERT